MRVPKKLSTTSPMSDQKNFFKSQALLPFSLTALLFMLLLVVGSLLPTPRHAFAQSSSEGVLFEGPATFDGQRAEDKANVSPLLLMLLPSSWLRSRTAGSTFLFWRPVLGSWSITCLNRPGGSASSQSMCARGKSLATPQTPNLACTTSIACHSRDSPSIPKQSLLLAWCCRQLYLCTNRVNTLEAGLCRRGELYFKA